MIAGPEVQALVEHSEQVIEALRQAARWWRCGRRRRPNNGWRRHPAAAWSATVRSDPTEQIAVTAPVNGSHRRRPPDDGGVAPSGDPDRRLGSGEASGYQHSASGSGLFSSHLVLKLGVVLAVLAVLLLLFA